MVDAVDECLFECLVDFCSMSAGSISLVFWRIVLPFVVNSLSSAYSNFSSFDASSPSAPWIGRTGSSCTPPSSVSFRSVPFNWLATTSTSAFSLYHPSRCSGVAPPGFPVVPQDHSSSPDQCTDLTACPLAPCTCCSALTSISQTPTATGTVGASRLATATIAPFFAFCGNGGPFCKPGVIRSAPPWIFSTTKPGVCSRGTMPGLCHKV